METTLFSTEAAKGGVQHVRGAHTAERYAATSWFRVYESSMLPGPLQHPRYAEAVQDFWAGHLRPGDSDGERAASVAEAVAGQQHRAALALSGRLDVVIEEAALSLAIGGQAVLERALLHVLETARDTPGLGLWVIPSGPEHGRDVPPLAPFWIFDSGLTAMEVAGAELSDGSLDGVAAAGDRFRRLQGIAVTGYPARKLLMAARDKAAGRG